jgi:L-threonylcarbamoyladenylate synthase
VTESKLLDAAAGVVRRGGVLIYPTETVYGLGCDPRSAAAIARVREIKGRDASKPMLAVTDRWALALPWLAVVPDAYRNLMVHEPPLPVTLVFEGSAEAPPALVSAEGTVAVRRTTDPFAGGLVAAAGVPVLSTSANSAGRPPAARFEDLEPEVVEAVDLAIDAGRPLAGIPSTVATIRDGELVVLREGALDAETLHRLARG